MSIYFINPTGDNANDGLTAATPWETLAYAITNSSADDTITFSAGTHTWENARVTMSSRVFQGATALTTIVDAGGTTNDAQWYLNDIVINDMTFTNNGNTSSGTNSWGSKVKNNTIFRGKAGVSDSTYEFNRCIFHNIAVGWGSSGNYGGALFDVGPAEASGGDVCSNLTINSCIIYDIPVYTGANATSAMFHGERTPTGGSKGSITVTNSTFYVNATGGNRLQVMCQTNANGLADDPSFTNCIIMNAQDAAWTWYDVPSLTNCDYNNMTGTVSATNSVTGDPLFIDPNNADFRLQQGSPAIDTGVAV